MDIQEMHNRFGLLTDRYGTPGFEPEEIDMFLNIAITGAISSRLKPLEDPEQKSKFEYNQTLIDELSSLVETTEPVISKNTDMAGFNKDAKCRFIKPDDYRNYLSSKVIISGNRVKAEVITVDQSEANSDDALNEASNSYPFLIFQKNSILLLCENAANVTGLDLTYLKIPDTVSLSGNVDCNLPVNLHDEIVMLAYNLAQLPFDELNKYQLSLLQTKKY